MERGLRGRRSAGGRIAPDALAMLPAMGRAPGIARPERADPALVERAKGAGREMAGGSGDAGLSTPREEICAEMDRDEWGREMPSPMRILES